MIISILFQNLFLMFLINQMGCILLLASNTRNPSLAAKFSLEKKKYSPKTLLKICLTL